MKNVLWKRFYAVMAFVSLVAAGSLTACSDNEDGYDSGVTGLTVPQELLSEGITVARSGGTATFAVQSLDAVQVSSSETWCTVQASAPSATLKAVTVTVTVQENTDVNDRTAIITLAAGSSSQQVSVKQTAADGLLVEAPAPVAAEGGTLEIALTTNGEPEVTCSVDWIARVQTKANMAERTYTFTVDKNESYSATDRIGRITFTLGTLTETVDVVQKPGRTYDWVGMNSDAVALAKQGYKVGLLDADIFGPSIPKMFGVEDARPVADDEGRIVPIEKYGIKLLSIGFFVNTGSAVVWRGAMASNAIKQLITEAAWGDLDFFLIDLPPGTSDIHLTIVQTIQLDGAIVVCTPQQVAIADAVKAIDMFENDKINVPVIGLIENMAWFSTPDMPGKKYYIFGRGGVEKLAEERGMALLGRIPIEENVCESSDAGTPLCLGSGGDVVQAFDNVAKSNIFAQISHK